MPPGVRHKSGQKIEKVLTALRAGILDDTWAVGSTLPNEKELAARFGCSAGTVNKALGILVHEGLVVRRNRLGTRVVRNSEVEAAPKALELDAVAFVFPGEQHEGIWKTLRGFQQAAQEAGRRLIMLSTGLDYHKETEVLARLSEFDVRGAVVFPMVPTAQAQMDFLKVVSESRFPLVLVEVSLPGGGAPSVMVDGFHAGYTMTSYLVGKGHRKIGFFSNYMTASFMRDRYQGYRWALKEAGLAEPEGGVMLEPGMKPNLADPLRESMAMVEPFIERCRPLGAVVCGNDYLAAALVRRVRQAGIALPQDLAVTGVDDGMVATSCEVPLTTYRVPYEQMGRAAFEKLNRFEKEADWASGETLIQGELVVRKSA